MHKEESLIVAYLLDGEGGGKKIGWEEIDQWQPEQGTLWAHLNYQSKQAAKWLKTKSGLDKVTVSAMLAEESRPRCVINAEGALVFLRGVNLNPGQDPEDMVSIRIWIDKHRIITTRRRRLLSIDDLREAIDSGLGPKTPPEFLVLLNDRLTNRMADVIDTTDSQVDDLEQSVLTAESHLLRPQIAEIRRQAIIIRRYLAPQREVLYRLQMEDIKFLNSNDRIHLRESTDRIIRYIEDLDSLKDRATIIQEELTSRLSEQLDRRMYLLSVVAVIFLPLTFITGLLGINVGGIPGANNKSAFAIVCIALLGLLAGLIWLLRRKKWM